MNHILAWLSNPSGVNTDNSCAIWDAGRVWVRGVVDVVTGLSYFCVSLVFTRFARRRHNLALTPVFWMPAAFILLCGAGYWLDLITLWVPVYGAQAGAGAAITL